MERQFIKERKIMDERANRIYGIAEEITRMLKILQGN